MMSPLKSAGGMAVLCSPDGTIERVLRDDLGFGDSLSPGGRLPNLFAEDEQERVRDFIREARAYPAVLDRQFCLAQEFGHLTLCLGGGIVSTRLLVVGEMSRTAMARAFYREMLGVMGVPIGPDAELKTQRTGTPSDELNRLSNELAAARWELCRKEEELQQSYGKFQALFADALDAIVIVDSGSGVISEANHTVGKYLGYREEQLVGKPFKAICPGYTQDCVADWRRTLGTHGGVLESQELVCADGSMHPMDVSVGLAPWKPEDAVVVTLRDATERVHTEEVLRETEQRYALAVQAGKTGVWEYRPDIDRLYLDENLKALCGYTENAYSDDGREWRTVVHPDDLSQLMEGLSRYIAHSSDYYQDEVRIIREDGSVRWVLIRGAAIREGQEQPTRILGTTTDITERRQAEDGYARVMAAVEQAAECMMITDADGLIQYVNPAFEQVTGYSREDALGKNAGMLNGHDEESPINDELWRTVKSGYVYRNRIVNKRKDGASFLSECTVSPVRDAHGTITNFVCVQQDVTGRVELEEQLRRAQKMEAIGTLAGGIAHDFNNILFAILGFAELGMGSVQEGSRAYGCLEHILAGAKRAADLIRQILMFSRESEEERRPLELQPVLKEAMKLLRGSLPSTIEISQAIDPNCRPALADPSQLHQVIMNLCTNAYHAMREHGGVLSVGLTEVELNNGDTATQDRSLAPGKYARLRFQDTGIGMDAATMERIFEPYFTTKPTGEGTGLGLATVHGIVKAHGGGIKVDSKPGLGATFDVFLPLYTQEAAAAEEKANNGGVPEGTERVLLIDDEEPIIRLGRISLGGLGYSVTTSTNSVDALDMFRATPAVFDVVVTDQTMPKMTGVELAKEILAIRPDMPIILCSGYTDTINEDETAALGIKAFLRKPMTRYELATAIRRVIDRA